MSNIADFYETQFALWPEVKKAYDALGHTQRKVLSSPAAPYPVVAQCNPARVKSTGADTSAKGIAARKCFLCKENRPELQLAGEAIPGWEILINPFPIFPVHFTIASREHKPQGDLPIDGMAAFLDIAPECVTFYNGASAGASAPDHLHFQAILKEELPLLKFVEKNHTSQPGTSSVKTAKELTPHPHYPFRSYLFSNDTFGGTLIQELLARTTPLSNVFLWGDSQGRLRALLFERKAHRPECYYKEGEQQLLVSPGAIDMAGVLILPVEEHFDRITPSLADEIYSQV